VAPGGRTRWSRSTAERWRRSWDAQQSYYLPEREARFSAMLDWLEQLVGRKPRCLDLGCGPGAVSERLLGRFPGARAVGVDYDPVLLRIGETGLGTVGGRMTWIDADLRRKGWRRRLPAGRYDAALSSTALHWLTGPQLTRLYRDLARVLRPGGVFLNADGLAFSPGARHLRAAARKFRHPGRGRPGRPTPGSPPSWHTWWEEVGKEPALRAELALRSARFPREHAGTRTPDLAGHRRRLLRAGFREAEVVWSTGESRVLAAVR
jgi:SAM-dependent methyltransferase